MTLLIPLAVIYGFGLVLTALIAGTTYSIERGYDDERARRAATWLLGSPIWPILAFLALLKLLAQAKATLKEDE